MNNTISYQEYSVRLIVNKKLKHSYIQIDREKRITLKTPIASQAFAQRFLAEKRAWIEKQFSKIDKLTSLHETQLFTQEDIQKRVEYFSELMGLEYKSLRFKKLKSMWGSCNSRAIITLNSELMRVEQNLIDYVIVHELAHLQHMNHSKDFHNLVESYLPSAKEDRKKLKTIRLT